MRKTIGPLDSLAVGRWPLAIDRWLRPQFRPTVNGQRRTTMNWLIKNFLRGLVIVVPIAVTIYILYVAFVWVDRLLPFTIPGAGFGILIVAIVAIGWLGSNFVGRKFVQLT